MGEVALQQLRNQNISKATCFISEYVEYKWKAQRAINVSRDSPSLEEFNRALNGDSTGPSGALIQATQSPLSHDNSSSTLRALGARQSSTRLQILRLKRKTFCNSDTY